MAKTRRQVTLQEQESGVPASPPQSLPTNTRATRAKRTATHRNTNTIDPPTEPPPSTRGGPAVRGSRVGRFKKVGRGRTQPLATASHDAPDHGAPDHDAPESSATDVDGPEASDSLTQDEVAVQATPTARQAPDDHDKVEHMEEIVVESSGETQSPISESAHPVLVQDMPALPVQGTPTTSQVRRESATSLQFREILNRSPRSPGYSPGQLTPNVTAPVVPLHSTIEPSPEVSTPTRASPLPSTPPVKSAPDASNPASPKPSSEAFTPTRASPLTSSLPVESFPQASIPASSKPSSETFTPTTASPLSSTPPVTSAPQVPTPTSPTPVYNMPGNPEQSHSLITIRMDHFQGSKDHVHISQPAAFAVPSELVGPICQYIESIAEAGSDLSKLTTDHPAVKEIVYGSARYRPQLPSWQSQQSPPIPRSTMRDSFIKKAQRKRGFRDMEEETALLKAENAKLKAGGPTESTESPPKRTKMVPDPWDADGQLVLGREKEIEVDEHGVAVRPWEEPSLRWNDAEARKAVQLEHERRMANVDESPYVAEENSDTDGPALGGLFAESQEQVPETPRARRWGLSSFIPSARSVTRYIPFSSRLTTSTPQNQPPQPQQVAQTEPPINASNSESHLEPDVTDTVAGPGHRPHQSRSNQQRLLTKEQSEEEKRIKKMRAKMRKEAEALEKQRKDLEVAKTALAEQQKSADVAQTPGQKRKRMPSPDIIPLPAGGGFGLVDEFFIVDSSSDEDLAAQETPTKERPLKKARTSAPDDAIVGSPFRARPYTGTLFAHPDASRPRQDDNVFVDANKPDPALNATPPPGPTLTFKVPSPASSDSDDEEDEPEQIKKPIQGSSSHSVPPPKSILRNSNSNQSQSRPIANSSPPSKILAPPPRPNPSHATLPGAPAMTPSGALEKAREKALRHQPKQPSTLRESSRLSSSTVNSDLGDEENVEEYDPSNPAIVQSPSKGPAFEQPAVSPTTPTGHQEPVTHVVSNEPHERQAVPETSEKQAENMSEVSTHADDAGSSAPAVPAEEQPQVLNTDEQIKADSDAKIKIDVDRWWNENGDEIFSQEGYEDFEADMLAEEQEAMDGPNGDPYHQPRNIISAALDRVGANGLSDRGIQTSIEDNWRPGDLERTESDPAKGMRVFFDRLVRKGVVEKKLANRVIEIGVPPEITKYLAGQDIMGPVAA